MLAAIIPPATLATFPRENPKSLVGFCANLEASPVLVISSLTFLRIDEAKSFATTSEPLALPYPEDLVR